MSLPFFPKKTYHVRLKSDDSTQWQKLAENTLFRHTLASTFTRMRFIGQVEEGSFRLITSKIGKGAFCVFEGTFEGSEGTIKVSVNSAFRVLIILWFIFFTSVGVVAIFASDINPIALLAMLALATAIVRGALTVLFNRMNSIGLSALSAVLGFEKVEEIRE